MISRTPANRAPVQTNELGAGDGIAGDQPRRCAGITLGGILPQTAVGPDRLARRG